MTHTLAHADMDAAATDRDDRPGANVFMRSDTLLGVCEALGQDFGFNPLWLRLAFIPAIFFLPVEAIAGYLALGVIVLASRLVFPNRTVQPAAPMAVEPAMATTTEPRPVAEPAEREPALLAA